MTVEMSKQQIIALKHRFEYNRRKSNNDELAILETAKFFAVDLLGLKDVTFSFECIRQGNVIAHTHSERKHIDFNTKNTEMLCNFWNFYHVTLHEIGHLCGLDHHDGDITDVMEPVWRGM